VGKGQGEGRWLKQQTQLRKLRGNFEWEGDLDAMRRDK
jgi:hypothetical protein